MSDRQAVALWFAVMVVMLWFIVAAAASSNRCIEFQPFFPREITGWHEESGDMVKCYRGQVVDYR